jgi:four helix bundle protein
MTQNSRDNKGGSSLDTGDSKIESFTDLNAWKRAHELVIAVYETTKEFPKREVYALIDQIHRSAVSVTSNISEGFGRFRYGDRLRFYRMARGSLTELQNQLLIAKDVGYLDNDKFDELANQSTKAHKLLQGLIRATKERKEGKDT